MSYPTSFFVNPSAPTVAFSQASSAVASTKSLDPSILGEVVDVKCSNKAVEIYLQTFGILRISVDESGLIVSRSDLTQLAEPLLTESDCVDIYWSSSGKVRWCGKCVLNELIGCRLIAVTLSSGMLFLTTGQWVMKFSSLRGLDEKLEETQFLFWSVL